MELKDLIITPFYLGFFAILALIIRPHVTNKATRKYFLPALWVKFFGAIMLGVIYQFYYDGGDTFNYYHDSSIIVSAFTDSLAKGFSIMFSNGEFSADTFSYTSQLYWYQAKSEFTVSRIGSIFGLITFNTYSSIALFFAAFCFCSMWAFYTVLVRLYMGLEREFAIAIFFIPSVFFWGSGYMKDTLALACIGTLFYSFYHLFIHKSRFFTSAIIFLLAIVILQSIRVYILLAFIPPAILWVYGENISRVRNKIAKYALLPVLLIPAIFAAYYAAMNVTEGDVRYDLDNIGKYAKINADYLYYVSVRQGGSAYSLGNLDGTIEGTVALAPQAILVAWFGPQLWNVKNVVMLLSAIENTLLAGFFLYLVFSLRPLRFLKSIVSDPYVQFALIFSLILGFAIGITSYNYGTLVRYKIPLLPFLVSALFIIQARMKKTKV